MPFPEQELQALEAGVTPTGLLDAAMGMVTDCFGAALIDTSAPTETSLIEIRTKRIHPGEAVDLLPAALYSMVAGPVVEDLLDVWERLRGHRSEVDDLRFVTGPVAHNAQRLASNPAVMLGVSIPTTANPRTVLLQLSRLCGRAVLT